LERNKKIAIVATILLVLLPLFLTAVPTVAAMTKAPYWAHVQVTGTSGPTKVWFANSIMQAENMTWVCAYNGTLGVGIIVVNFGHLMVSTVTGQGTFIATWTITVGDSTLSGTANGRITGGLTGTATGYFAGTHGTGTFARIEKMGTFVTNLATGSEDEQGVIIFH